MLVSVIYSRFGLVEDMTVEYLGLYDVVELLKRSEVVNKIDCADLC